jgi:hypothetical protein
MQQPVDNTGDSRFWACFAACSERLAKTAEEADLPVGWWNWPFSRRAQELSTLTPKAAPLDRVDLDTVERVAVGALMVCEKKPRDFTVAIQQRVAAMAKLVEQKGEDYNAGGVSILEYWPEGASNIVFEIHKRALRLLSLARSRQQPRFDGGAEIGLDIAAFSVFLLAYIHSECSPSAATSR